MNLLNLFGIGSKAHPMPEAGSMATSLAATEGEYGVAFEVRNTSDRPQTFCIFQTPLEDFRADYLDVTDASGAEMRYIGVKIKRKPPSKRHFVKLGPGESRRASFRLDAGYALDGQRPFTVRFRGGPEINGLPDSNEVTLGA